MKILVYNDGKGKSQSYRAYTDSFDIDVLALSDTRDTAISKLLLDLFKLRTEIMLLTKDDAVDVNHQGEEIL